MTSEMLDITVLSPNHRINLSESARKVLKVNVGDKVAIIKEDNEIKIRKD